MSAKRIKYITRCKRCGAEIKQPDYKSKGFCNKCKYDIMQQWQAIPYDVRDRILQVLKEAQIQCVEKLAGKLVSEKEEASENTEYPASKMRY